MLRAAGVSHVSWNRSIWLSPHGPRSRRQPRGLVFGLVAVALMLPLRFDDKRRALAAAFASRFATGLVIGIASVAQLSGWARGLGLGLLMSIPTRS